MTDDKPRRKLTDRQRAEQVKAVAQRRVDRLRAQRNALTAAGKRIDRDLDTAEKRLAYVAADPALAGAGTTTATETGTTEAEA